ncbi:MAG TPA: MATE family efflux transporter [Gammaproteobacteria bacterium]|nr:MATE family efflux transporter [Gammaproteobacteria bacterium]HIK70652.1 MATE family efflux transporter [Pseudomonadales bacterium]
MTLPMILGISSSLLAGLAETFYLGQLGSTELAALGFTFPVTSALMSLTLGVSIGLSSVLAREVGAGEDSKVKRIATDGLSFAVILMIVVSIIGMLTITPVFKALGADNSTLPLITEYMQLWYLSLLFMAIPSVGANALRATGDARTSGIIMIMGSILQILLSPMLIFGWFGLPPLGMAGAAAGNLLSRILMFTVTFYILVFREKLIIFQAVALSSILESWKKILEVSIPATATNLIGPISSAIIVSMLASYSQETVAGFGIASRIEGLFVIPLFALSASIGPFVGQNWGAGEFKRANHAMLIAFKSCMLWGLLVAAILWVSREPIIRLFNDQQDVIDAASIYLLIIPVSYGAWGMLMMASAIFNALGKPYKSTAMSVMRMFVIYIPLALLGNRLFGLPGIFIATCLSNLLAGLLGVIWNRYSFGGLNHSSKAPATNS